MYSVYILQNSVTKTFYVGYTSNLKRRIEQHNNKESNYTSKFEGEWVLVYAEAYRNKTDAIIRENKFKERGRTKQELIKRIKNSLL